MASFADFLAQADLALDGSTALFDQNTWLPESWQRILQKVGEQWQK